tara:strand:+ start:13 stop:261 length:249 start_codon:yes stop_codon:yes gene_type:complete
MRKTGSESKKLCWRVRITQGDLILHNKDYTTLKIAGDELGLSYSQICDLKPGGRNKKKSIAFKFYPRIEILKLQQSENLVEC